jgi:ElaB/YqjD/DUF883 family membrane-anchored ribosome-binding protein
MDSLGRRIGASPAMRTAANYVQAQSWKDVAAGIDRLVRQRPGASIAIAVVAGFVVGRALRPR